MAFVKTKLVRLDIKMVRLINQIEKRGKKKLNFREKSEILAKRLTR